MKRLVVRIGALGTVVVLGLIAIAQAQRGSEGVPPASDETAPAGNQASGEGEAVFGVGGSGNQLRGSATGGVGDNPLRLMGRRPASSEAVPTAEMLTASQPGDFGPILSESPLSGRSAEPFEFRAESGGAAIGAGMGQVVPAANEMLSVPPPESRPQGFAPQEADYPQVSGYPRVSGQPAPGGPSVGASATVGDMGAAVAGGYPELRAAGSEIGEPGRLRADPSATPTVFPTPELAAPGNPATATAAALGGGPLPAGEGTGQPGSKQLEGPQCPQLTIQKSAPAEIQVGKKARFRVTVRNTGSIAAHEVEVRDRVPKGARLISTAPRASRGADGALVWAVGTLRPGDESSVEIQLQPVAEGEIGSVATVRFQADASARSVVTKPELLVKTSAPGQVLRGEEITLKVEISNPGSGVATGVVLEEHVPAGMEHPAGPTLEYEIGDLAAGESRKLELTLLASRPGRLTNILTARAEGNLKTEDRLDLEVIAPLLKVAVAGPKRRYLEREATYRLSVHNPGTAPANQVELVAYLPDGLKFVSANNYGHYEEADRTVHWQLQELPSTAEGTVELVTLPVEPGQQTIRLRSTADRGVSAEGQQPVLVEGIAAIKFQVVDVTDPIEVGGETTYEIRVVNQGSKAATNVRLAVLLPAEMRAVGAEGPTRHVVEGGRVLFEGLSRLAPKADTTYRVRALGLKPGDLRISAQLMTDEMRLPVTKEESTRVYSDQ